MKNYKTYLFDIDGTLLDTQELIFQSFKYIAKKYADYDIPREEVIKNVGRPLKPHLEELLNEHIKDNIDNVIEDFRAYQRGIYKETLALFPMVKETLIELESRGCQIGIVTSRTIDSLGPYLEFTDIFSHFTVIATPAETENHKPHPEPVLWALKQFNAEKESTLFVGDATFDIESGNSAGVDTCFVNWSHNSVETLKSKPTFTIESMAELL